MVSWSDAAKADLRRIHRFIAADSASYANKVTAEIREKTGLLAELPRIGRVVPELGDESVRELSAYNYRILYEIKSNDVIVLGIAHKRQNLQAEDISGMG